MHPLLKGLNAAQQKALTHQEGPLLIVAGPGTGKTRTLVRRIAYLIEEARLSPDCMLAITFTNRAAEEMSARLPAIMDESRAARILAGTFHAIALIILRNHWDMLHRGEKFTILDREDQENIIREIAGSMQIPPGKLRQAITAIKSTANQVSLNPLLLDAINTYGERLAADECIDYDDLIVLNVKLFRTHPEILESYRRQWSYLFVDEFQDANPIQFEWIKLLAAPKNNLCCIGDPDQAIYAFRGANMKNFFMFREQYPEAEEIHLVKNYRSSGIIVEAASQVIAHNMIRLKHAVQAQSLEGVSIRECVAESDKAEADTVVKEIDKLMGGTSSYTIDSGQADATETSTVSFADIAILYRLKAQRYAMEQALQKAGLPYQVVGGDTQWRKTPEVKAAQTYMRIAQGDIDESLLFSVLNFPPRGLGDAARAILTEACRDRPLAELLMDDRVPAGMSAAQDAGRRQLGKVLRDLMELLLLEAFDETFDKMMEITGLMQYVQKNPGLERLARLSRHAASVDELQQLAALDAPTDIYNPTIERITLMTMHAAKGLEFPVVFLTGCEDGILPYRREDEELDMEEERRLFYVAMTRARDCLFLCRSKRRFLFGKQFEGGPSPFLAEFESALRNLSEAKKRFRKKASPTDAQTKLFEF